MNLAIIGCGAVVEQFHLPALKRLGIKPTLFIDSNINRAKVFAKKYNSQYSSDYNSVVDNFDSAILSVPHFLHKTISVHLLNKNKHVFIEKPLANTVEECNSIISAKNKCVVSVGLLRRFIKANIWLKGLLDSGDLGEIKEFSFREGSVYSWPVKTDSFWKKDKSGGGVLIDTGAHTLDQLCWWFGEISVLSYKDNSYGGVESDCFIHLKLNNGTTGTVDLSRTRNLGAYCLIKAEKGIIKIGLIDNTVQTNNPLIIKKIYNDIDINQIRTESYVKLFILQLSEWINKIESGEGNIITANSAKDSIEIIQKCYKMRTNWSLPWVVV